MIRRDVSQIVLALGAAIIIGLAYATITPALHIAAVSMAAVILFMACVKVEHRSQMAWRASLIVIAMPVIAWANSNVWLLYAIMAVGVPLVAVNRAHIVPVYIFALLLLPAMDMSIVVGPLKLFDISVHDALVAGAAVGIMRDRNTSSDLRRFDVAVGATILLIGAALSRETSVSNLIRQSINVVVDLGLPYYVVSRGLRTKEEVRDALLWLACGAVTLAAILGYESLKTWPMYNMLYAQYAVPMQLLVKARAGYLRAAGPFIEPTSGAMVQSICILAIALSGKCFRSRHHQSVIFTVGVLGLLAPQSRGAWIGLFLGLLAADAFRGRYSLMTIKAGVVMALGCCLYLAASVSSNVAQSIGLAGDSSGTADYRRDLLHRGLDEFWQSPIIGYSMPVLQVRLADMRQGEGIIDFVNAYIWIALISGTGGLIIFFGAFLFIIRMVWQHGDRKSAASRDSAAYVSACLLMIMEMLFFTSFGTRPATYTYVVFGLGAALVAVCRSANRAAEVSSLHSMPMSRYQVRLAR